MSKNLFVQENDIVQDIVEIKNDELLHLKVQRCQVGDFVEICNNSGKVFKCEIFSIEKNSAKARILEQRQSDKELANKLCLCFALSKADKMEFVVQKATELGITDFIPFSSAYTVVKENTTRLDRLDKIAREACKQCGGAVLPTIHSVKKITDLPKYINHFDKVLLAYEKSNKKFDGSLLNKSIAVIVGSEGGFSEEEIKILEKSIKNLETISLGKRILRAETACVVALTMALNKMGEL